MKKTIIFSALALFIGGVAHAAKTENTVSTISLNGEIEILGSGYDDGGFFVIVSTDTECKKVYPNNTSGHGMFDH